TTPLPSQSNNGVSVRLSGAGDPGPTDLTLDVNGTSVTFHAADFKASAMLPNVETGRPQRTAAEGARLITAVVSTIDQRVAVVVELMVYADVGYDLVFEIDPRQSVQQTWPQIMGIHGVSANESQEAINPFSEVSEIGYGHVHNTLNIVTSTAD